MKFKIKKKLIPSEKVISLKTYKVEKISANNLNVPEYLQILNPEQIIYTQNSNKVLLIVLIKIKKCSKKPKNKTHKINYIYIRFNLKKNQLYQK